MAIAEESRHRLYQRPEQILGPDEAAILMSSEASTSGGRRERQLDRPGWVWGAAPPE